MKEMKMIKNIFKSGIFALITLFALTACDPQDGDDYSMGALDTITENQVSFSYAPTDKSTNEIRFTVNVDSKVPTSVLWNLGNDVETKERNPIGQYPYAGDYTVILTVYASDGTSITKSQILHLENNDFSLLDTPGYRNLTGGADNVEGKTWVLDQYNGGHFGVFPTDLSWSWYAGANEKDGSSLYTQEFTFIQTGTKLYWKNNGYIYTNQAGVNALASLGYTNSHSTPVDDFDVEYSPAPGGYTFILNENDNTLTFTGGAFFGFYAGTSTYNIVELTEDVLEVTCVSTLESNNNWSFRFIPKDKNVKPERPLKAIPLREDFEEESAIAWGFEEMGTRTGVSDNPNFTGNSSAKVYRYEKTTSPSSNMFFLAPDYTFDLTTQNKIRVKVLMPSFNDYTTDNGKEDWAPSAKLLPKLAIKLYDSSHPEPWNDGKVIEKVLTADQLDKWIELEFDFSEVADRTNYDQIVIQFGQEGHYGPGIFYFDDFTFSE